MIAATYFGIAETALLLPAINSTATPLWPPTGLESLIESFIELMSQVFMLPIFHRRTSC